jgi:transcriptional regulator of nitric oxide reductase
MTKAEHKLKELIESGEINSADASKQEGFIKGWNEALNLPHVGRTLVCDMCGSSKLEECTKDEYACEDCGHFPITN